MKKALATLPWVEQDSVKADVKTKEARFTLKDPGQFNEQELLEAIKTTANFPDAKVLAQPAKKTTP